MVAARTSDGRERQCSTDGREGGAGGLEGGGAHQRRVGTAVLNRRERGGVGRRRGVGGRTPNAIPIAGWTRRRLRHRCRRRPRLYAQTQRHKGGAMQGDTA